MKQGFSLVELSIVLVILGLLTGGILAGQSLIRAAELRTVTTQYNQYVTATQTFRDKYMALPGDMRNATQFWGDDNAACADAAITNGTPGTCNGDGSSTFSTATGNSGTGEEFQFWKQLALAGLIEGSYSGLAGGSSLTQTVIGTNVPPGRVGSTGFSVFSPGVQTSNAVYFDGDYNNTVQIGTQITNGRTGGLAFKTEEVWNIDTKMDDGKPAYGMVRTEKPTSGNAPNCADGSTSSAEYKLSDTGISCRIFFALAR